MPAWQSLSTFLSQGLKAIAHSQCGQVGSQVLSGCYLPTLAWRRRVKSLSLSLSLSLSFCPSLLYTLSNGQGPPSPTGLLPATVRARTNTVLQSFHSFCFPSAKPSRHLSSFLYFSIDRVWNNLSASAMSQSRSVSSFRSFLHSFYKISGFKPRSTSSNPIWSLDSYFQLYSI